MNSKLKNAISLYMEGIRDGNAKEAVTKYTGDRYTQHSTGVKNGAAGFIEFFEDFILRCPHRDIQILRAIVDGQYVFLQAVQNINQGETQWVTTDLFDTDSNDKIIEHWDVISALETNDQISGDCLFITESKSSTKSQPHTDETLTELNKNRVRDFLCDVMVLGDKSKLNEYLDINSLKIHATQKLASLLPFIGHYNQVFKIIGQDDQVASYSRVIIEQQEYARFDFFQVEQGKIKAMWTNQEIIPPQDQWVNGGKF